jgi:cytidine deaminase
MPERKKLLEAARSARQHAFAPYSLFLVGAAVLTKDGEIITGCNIESASYGLTCCAERVALFKAISQGKRRFKCMAVVADSTHPTPPCGACRQVIWELAGDIEIILGNLAGETKTFCMHQLFPHPFDAEFLPDEMDSEDDSDSVSESDSEGDDPDGMVADPSDPASSDTPSKS